MIAGALAKVHSVSFMLKPEAIPSVQMENS
jgi:hypothetical protein